MFMIEQAQKRLERRVVRAAGGRNAPHVIYDHGARQVNQAPFNIRQFGSGGLHDHVPAQRCDVLRHILELGQRKTTVGKTEKPHAAHTGIIQFSKVRIRGFGAGYGNAPRILPIPFQGIQQASMISAVGAGLYVDGSGNAKFLPERQVVLERGTVDQFLCRKPARRSVNMHVRVAYAFHRRVH